MVPATPRPSSIPGESRRILFRDKTHIQEKLTNMASWIGIEQKQIDELIDTIDTLDKVDHIREINPAVSSLGPGGSPYD